MKKSVLFILFSICVLSAISQNKKIDSLKLALQTAKEDTNKINKLNSLSTRFLNINLTESLNYGKSALRLAQKLNSGRHESLAQECIGNAYFNLPDYPNALDNYQQALKISAQIGWKREIWINFININHVYASIKDYPKALENCQQALKMSREIGDKWLEARSLSNVGRVYFDLNDYPIAIDYFQQAVKLSNDIGKKIVEGNNLNFIGNVYEHMSDYSKALDYHQQALAIFTKENGVGGIENSLSDIGTVYMNLKEYAIALNYFQQALKLSIKLGDKNWEAISFNHIGKVNQKISDYPKALDNELKSLEIAKEIGLLDVERDTYYNLKNIYEKTNKPVKALDAYEQYISLRDSIVNIDKQKEITRKSIQYDFDLKEAAVKAERDKKDLLAKEEISHQKLQRNAFIGGGILLLLLLGVAVNRYRFENKAKKTIASEKQRSDELLLNILPAETAEELKKYGKASAKGYDEVTVLFADIKGFTIISENLAPDILVKELDNYFQEFDNVIEQYGLEKIKTIGDAYLCVGGLPIPDDKAPEKVIIASLEMLKYLEKVKAEKAPLNEPYFEIRIGIHTGPCVAGVVGVKKFAYDIWGDTVNTAARMEQNSESGKINISETTYQLVKDQFKCTYRGLIEAKNKGEIKMYFVDGEI